MGTPAHLLISVSRHAMIFCIGLFAALIVCNFIYVLHVEHTTARQRLMDDQWLLKRCGEPDFYMRLKQHTDLCEGVEANARRSILLHSLASALRSTQLCGFDSCTNIAKEISDAILRGGIITIATAIAILFTIPLLFTVIYRRFVDSVSEHHLRTKYNMPYGLNTSLIHSQRQMDSNYNFNNPQFRTHTIEHGSHDTGHHIYPILPDNI
jgi:hypothetical protein